MLNKCVETVRQAGCDARDRTGSETDRVDLSLSSGSYSLCDFEQLVSPLWASFSSFVILVPDPE